MLIPDLTLQSVIVAGLAALRSNGIPLLQPEEVYQELEDAVKGKRPYSLVRVGDGELLTLAQEKVLSIEDTRNAGPYLAYAGVNLPDLKARDELAEATKKATLLGVPLSRRPYFQPLLFQVWKAHGISFDALNYTSSLINYSLHETGLLMRLLEGRSVLVIGDLAQPLADKLLVQGIAIAGVISPVYGFKDVERVVAAALAYTHYDIALVAAGIAAVPICVRIAERSGKVAIDLGHQANRIAGIVSPKIGRSH